MLWKRWWLMSWKRCLKIHWTEFYKIRKSARETFTHFATKNVEQELFELPRKDVIEKTLNAHIARYSWLMQTLVSFFDEFVDLNFLNCLISRSCTAHGKYQDFQEEQQYFIRIKRLDTAVRPWKGIIESQTSRSEAGSWGWRREK